MEREVTFWEAMKGIWVTVTELDMPHHFHAIFPPSQEMDHAIAMPRKWFSDREDAQWKAWRVPGELLAFSLHPTAEGNGFTHQQRMTLKQDRRTLWGQAGAHFGRLRRTKPTFRVCLLI